MAPTPHRPARARRALRLRGGQADAREGDIDSDLYSRQLYVLGHAAQRSLAASAVLLIGLSGLGAEIGKNVVLAGVGAIDVHDDTPASYTDLSSSFLLGEADLSHARSLHAAERLAPLNPHVRVGRVDGPFTPELLTRYSVVVAVDRPLPEQLVLNDAARSVGCRFISASSRGPCGSIFCDFGEGFRVEDKDGEEAKQALLEHIEVGEETAVVCVQEQPHGLQDGDVVRFEEVGSVLPKHT
jgi:ubiquitin-activating enzyme E1